MKSSNENGRAPSPAFSADGLEAVPLAVREFPENQPLSSPRSSRRNSSIPLRPGKLRSPSRWTVWIATGFGVGYLPVMPGTYGSALGVALYFGLAALARKISYPKFFLFASAVAVAAFSIMVVAAALSNFTDEDPQPIVLDEVAGQIWALFPLSLLPPETTFYWGAVAAGFLLFRALDAIKPYPVWKLERLGGAWGVVADDLAAGGLAAILLAGLIRFGWNA